MGGQGVEYNGLDIIGPHRIIGEITIRIFIIIIIIVLIGVGVSFLEKMCISLLHAAC